jgi:hypothetical protein
VCSINVERSWGYCPNCNYWLGDLNDSGSRHSDDSSPSGGFSDVGGGYPPSEYTSAGSRAADADKFGCTLGLFDEVESGCGCAWASFVLVAVYTVALFVLVTVVSTTVGQILLGIAAVVAAVVAYRRWISSKP